MTKYLVSFWYFILGLLSITSVVNIYFTKSLLLSTSQLIGIGIWSALPWSSKLLFSSVIDRFSAIARPQYATVANILILLGNLGLATFSLYSSTLSVNAQYLCLLWTGLATNVGLVLGKLIYDTIIIEISTTEAEQKAYQVLSRRALLVGGLLAASLSGIVHRYVGLYHSLLIPVFLQIVAFISTQFLSVPRSKFISTTNTSKFILIGIFFTVLFILIGIFIPDTYSQWLVFSISLLSFGYLFFNNIKTLQRSDIRIYLLSFLAIFLFRINPSAGPGLTWFYMTKFGIDDMFLGNLNLIGQVVSLVSITAFTRWLTSSVAKSLILLTILMLLLSLPDLLIYYGYTFGMPVRALLLADSAGLSAVANLSMVPLGILVARYFSQIEQGARVTYIAITASLANLALMLGDLLSKQLNLVFIVTRTDFSQLGMLLLATLGISVLTSVVGIGLLRHI